MRDPADLIRIRRLFNLVGNRCLRPLDVYFTGGVTAVFHGWRDTTIDVDLKPEPEADEFLRLIPKLKEELDLNIELACPADFIPELPSWRERSLFIAQEGRVRFLHYDPYAQALAKIERGHAQDVEDVQNLFRSGLVEPARLLEFFARIEPMLYKYPAIDPASFRRSVEAGVAEVRGREPLRK